MEIAPLEPYDNGRIPVLFVHGINGAPGDFRAVLAALDHARFQAWMLRYPTDQGLRTTARAMGDKLQELHRRHRYPALIIVAHSMGGLVSRRHLIDALREEMPGVACALVTLASPWGGNEWAGIGAVKAPRPLDSWVDLAPESAFLASLRHPLAGVPHHVLFGYRRGMSLLTPQSSDGAITLASQIPDWIQEQATSVRGFDADHAGILSHAAVLKRLNLLLAAEAERMRPVERKNAAAR